MSCQLGKTVRGPGGVIDLINGPANGVTAHPLPPSLFSSTTPMFPFARVSLGEKGRGKEAVGDKLLSTA